MSFDEVCVNKKLELRQVRMSKKIWKIMLLKIQCKIIKKNKLKKFLKTNQLTKNKIKKYDEAKH